MVSCILPTPELIKLWEAPPRGALLVLLGARVYCMSDIFILNEIWAQDKLYILMDILLG
jgi:hypothetical protein